jgi:hypothetical protein
MGKDDGCTVGPWSHQKTFGISHMAILSTVFAAKFSISQRPNGKSEEFYGGTMVTL